MPFSKFVTLRKSLEHHVKSNFDFDLTSRWSVFSIWIIFCLISRPALIIWIFQRLKLRVPTVSRILKLKLLVQPSHWYWLDFTISKRCQTISLFSINSVKQGTFLLQAHNTLMKHGNSPSPPQATYKSKLFCPKCRSPNANLISSTTQRTREHSLPPTRW